MGVQGLHDSLNTPDAEMIERRLLDPDDRFLQKPFRLQALTSHIQSVLGDADNPVARAPPAGSVRRGLGGVSA